MFPIPGRPEIDKMVIIYDEEEAYAFKSAQRLEALTMLITLVQANKPGTESFISRLEAMTGVSRKSFLQFPPSLSAKDVALIASNHLKLSEPRSSIIDNSPRFAHLREDSLSQAASNVSVASTQNVLVNSHSQESITKDLLDPYSSSQQDLDEAAIRDSQILEAKRLADEERKRKIQSELREKAVLEKERIALEKKQILERAENDKRERLAEQEQKRLMRAAAELQASNAISKNTQIAQPHQNPIQDRLSPRAEQPVAAQTKQTAQNTGINDLYSSVPAQTEMSDDGSEEEQENYSEADIQKSLIQLMYNIQQANEIKRRQQAQSMPNYDPNQSSHEFFKYLESLNGNPLAMREAIQRRNQFMRGAKVPEQPAPGHILGSNVDSTDLDNEFDEIIEGKKLDMIDQAPVCTVRVRLPGGGQESVKLHYTHTIQDLYLHIGTLTKLTSRLKLEIVGTKGELVMTQTVEQAGIKQTLLHLVRK